MPREPLDEAFDSIVKAAADRLKGLGFKRRGTVIRVIKYGNSGVIQFQRSTESTRLAMLFTVNLAIIVGELLEPDGPTLDRATSMYGHLRERIGFLLPDPHDRWWQITAETNVTDLAAEIADILSDVAAPYIERYLDTGDLVALWRSGNAPGITKIQRIRYVGRLTGNYKV